MAGSGHALHFTTVGDIRSVVAETLENQGVSLIWPDCETAKNG
jgi:hypothetical protein